MSTEFNNLSFPFIYRITNLTSKGTFCYAVFIYVIQELIWPVCRSVTDLIENQSNFYNIFDPQNYGFLYLLSPEGLQW